MKDFFLPAYEYKGCGISVLGYLTGWTEQECKSRVLLDRSLHPITSEEYEVYWGVETDGNSVFLSEIERILKWYRGWNVRFRTLEGRKELSEFSRGLDSEGLYMITIDEHILLYEDGLVLDGGDIFTKMSWYRWGHWPALYCAKLPSGIFKPMSVQLTEYKQNKYK